MSISKISKLRSAVGKVPHSFIQQTPERAITLNQILGRDTKTKSCHPSQARVEERDIKESITPGGL